MRRPRSERLPPGEAGIWHIVSRCVRREMLMEGRGRREWMAKRFAAWLDILAVDLLGYALMGNHLHVVVRTRPDVAAKWSDAELSRRVSASSTVHEGLPMPLDQVASPSRRLAGAAAREARDRLSHPGPMLRAVKEGFARWVNQREGAAGHVWESRYQDIALADAGGVLACLVYVDLNPFRAGLVRDPRRSAFCSARHRQGVDEHAADVELARRLVVLTGHPLLDAAGKALGSWRWERDTVDRLTEATATCLRTGTATLPSWALELLPRLGLSPERWTTRMGTAGVLSGNVLGSLEVRRRLAGDGRMASDKSELYMRPGEI
jgi:hypothetical protein